MKVINYLKIVYIFINYCDSFKSDDYCALPDRYVQQVKCKEFSCANKFCSAVKNDCKSFTFWSYLTTTHIISYDMALYRYKKFLKAIKECSPNMFILRNTEGICLKSGVSYEKNKKTSRFMNKMIRLCECKGKHGYNCENGYCATSKLICKLSFEKGGQQMLIKNVKSCR